MSNHRDEWFEGDTARYLANRAALTAAHAYSPGDERDACGVGLVCAVDGKPRREVVELAITALKSVWHRGAVDADGKTGDGAGVLLSVPQDFFADQVTRIGHVLRPGPIAVGQVFLPRNDLGAQEAARTIVEAEALRFGFYIYGWRQVPVDTSVIGEKANATRPEIEQIMLSPPAGLTGEALERALFLCRKRIEKRVAAAGIQHFYLCSFSARQLIYKGMFLAQHIDEFYPDLRDERFAAAVAIFHQRYSTNTFPEWRLAQPFRMLAHNGEINTKKGNVNWMRSHEIRMAADAFGEMGDDVKPVIQDPHGSDSMALDNTFEVLVRAGRDAPMVKALLIPEAWNARSDEQIKPAHKALYAYCNSVMEPWDGPAAVCATDGRWVVAGKDRNGLRPLRVAYTDDGLLIMGSEAGMCRVDEARIIKKSHISAGRMIAVDLAEGRLYGEDEIIDELAVRHPYDQWLGNMVDLENEIAPGPEPRAYSREELIRRQVAAGMSLEDIELILAPMVEDAKEAVGSMGDDAPLAVLSDQYRPLSHFFRQNFSQVTNPPIDSLRETSVMSLKTRFKNLGNILAQDEAQTDVFVLESPVLTTGMYQRIAQFIGDKNVAVIDCTMPVPAAESRPGDALRANLDRIRAEAEDAALRGCATIVLTDEAAGPERIGLPMILATGGVHSSLVAKGLRSYVSIIVRSAECLDTHYFAVLVGVGATAVNAYLAQESFQDRLDRGLTGDLTLRQLCLNFKHAIEGGLLKIIAKMGIAVISSYRGGLNFEALGLSRALVAEFFPGMPSRISGIGLAGIEAKALELHRKAWDAAAISLPVGGFYKARRTGEAHAFEARMIHALQRACDTGNYAAYKTFSEGMRRMPTIQLRDLLDLRSPERAVSLDEVESVNEIRKRFLTPGMSMGALSPEAHGVLNIAMNRIGAKSVSGEGGEDPARYKPLPNGDNPNSAVKQIASGRFGVTAQYLNECREIEIKVSQGAKPGEGGQLPGFKVTELIAKLRHSTPGVMLISPPPHHDIYSIEDLAQLIYDLKQINPEARVCVKLVAMTGIGAIAAGVAKAKADVILISGNVGGTGASPQTSIKYAGGPWEMGLSEANQVLTLNNLRHSVRLRADGGMRTGRDVVIAAMLGAEEFGIGTASLIAMGCIMVRQCHSNTCPVGVCTQDQALRDKFSGSPEKVINLFTFIAEEVREILAGLGFRSLNEIVGRTDLLQQVSRGGEHLDDLDLNPLLVRADPGPHAPFCTVEGRNEVPDTLDAQIVRDAAPLLERGEKMQLTYTVRNTARAIGSRTSSHIVRKFGMEGLPPGHLTVQLKGSAGQSLGAFAVQGLRIELTGEANDYVGKGLSGATLIIRPAPQLAAAQTNAIIGNTVLYGATSGRLFAAGLAGERFGVRNSGAVTVVEGCGTNGLEYMTGGVAVVLGPVGFNFAAGMTGGMAYVLDLDDRFLTMLNTDSVVVERIGTRHWEAELKALVEEHARETGSPLAETILRDWDRQLPKFWQVVPKEMVHRLDKPLAEEEAVHHRA
ncbi:glutamate synthase [Phenylobacterium sp. Root77]|uniref:glutamate synthase large subunit n=1 Tax=unclassified Phenylobacterium TaxID=2640670 RepID=UPI0006FF482C|nr:MULTISPECIES: glutamate synthase large subunit [unclassified Phenylobacterium]KQW69344.1 glutamate synthase [Phenylobacterium sp. Root1277]KQW95290.1 glutamate synthase [Phenylobacterium sp. Root1290]KRC41081.1 glutamate synthase [Phenylobacterium sp. Root77]